MKSLSLLSFRFSLKQVDGVHGGLDRNADNQKLLDDLPEPSQYRTAVPSNSQPGGVAGLISGCQPP
jgi:hypothetical protein